MSEGQTTESRYVFWVYQVKCHQEMKSPLQSPSNPVQHV
jgi:hypothetical protein